MGQITSFPFLASFFTCLGIYLTFHLLNFLVIIVARRRRWLIGRHSSTVTPIHGGDASFPPAAGGPSSQASALDTIKAPDVATSVDSPSVHTPETTQATTLGGGALPTFAVALKSKLLVGPGSYEKRELAK